MHTYTFDYSCFGGLDGGYFLTFFLIRRLGIIEDLSGIDPQNKAPLRTQSVQLMSSSPSILILTII